MASEQKQPQLSTSPQPTTGLSLTLDWWAVIIAFVLVALVIVGLSIPW